MSDFICNPLSGFDHTVVMRCAMSNTFFKIDSPEKHDEVYDKWLQLSRAEQQRPNAPKARIYVSVEEIDLIQDALQIMLQTADRVAGGLEKSNERKVMQMGYGLEEIKTKLKKRIETRTVEIPQEPK